MPTLGTNAKTRAHQKCKRCGKTRAELSKGMFERLGITGVCFTNGKCRQCDWLLRYYHNNEELCKAHEANRFLKKLAKECLAKEYHNAEQN